MTSHIFEDTAELHAQHCTPPLSYTAAIPGVRTCKTRWHVVAEGSDTARAVAEACGEEAEQFGVGFKTR